MRPAATEDIETSRRKWLFPARQNHLRNSVKIHENNYYQKMDDIFTADGSLKGPRDFPVDEHSLRRPAGGIADERTSSTGLLRLWQSHA